MLVLGAIINLLFLVGAALVGFQLLRIRDALAEMQVSTQYLEAAVTASQQAAKLVAITQQSVAARRDPDQLIRGIAPTMLALQQQRALLWEEARALPSGSALRTQMASAATTLGNVTNVTGQIIRAVNQGNWRLADYLVNELMVNYRLTEQESDSLLLLTRSLYEDAQSEAGLAVRQVTVIVPLIILLVLLLSAGGAVASMRWIAAINPLSRAARQLAEGRLETRVPLLGLEEFRFLARTFNDMATKFQQLYSGLERMVAQRTAELARRTAQLEAAAQVARRAAEIRDLDTLLNET
ncbi:MAG: HAMP domain-containing protein, partial [Anaerolineae bacterium]